MSSKKRGAQSKKATDRRENRDVFSRKKKPCTAQNVAMSVSLHAWLQNRQQETNIVQFVFQPTLQPQILNHKSANMTTKQVANSSSKHKSRQMAAGREAATGQFLQMRQTAGVANATSVPSFWTPGLSPMLNLVSTNPEIFIIFVPYKHTSTLNEHSSSRFLPSSSSCWKSYKSF